MADLSPIEITLDSSEFKSLISEFNKSLDARDVIIDNLTKRVEAIERCPAVESDLG